MSRNLRYSEDELREQWAFIDSLVDSQAAALRSGAQDPEEEPMPPPISSALIGELDVLRERVKRLEAERDQLLERVRIAEAAGARAAVQPDRGGVESRVRGWWRRISR